MKLAEDELWLRIRAALDAYVLATRPGERTTDGIAKIVLGCFGEGLLEVGFAAASGASDPLRRGVVVRFDDRVGRYAARATHYLETAIARHDARPLESLMTVAGSPAAPAASPP